MGLCGSLCVRIARRIGFVLVILSFSLCAERMMTFALCSMWLDLARACRRRLPAPLLRLVSIETCFKHRTIGDAVRFDGARCAHCANGVVTTSPKTSFFETPTLLPTAPSLSPPPQRTPIVSLFDIAASCLRACGILCCERIFLCDFSLSLSFSLSRLSSDKHPRLLSFRVF